jgi:cytochrome c-type biogenesis protein CcmF
LKAWTILLAIVTFSLSLIGTFIVRSGLLTSVHAFATDPERGLFILALLSITIGGSLLLYAWRAPALKGGGLFAPVSREGGLVLNNLLLSVACGTVFIGTMSPLFIEAFGQKISVGVPYYNVTFVPIIAPLVAVMAVGPFLAWKRADLAGVLSRLKFVGLVSFLAGLGVYLLAGGGGVLAAVALTLALWLFLGTLLEWSDRVKLLRARPAESWRRIKGLPRAAHGMTLAHLGLAVAIAGMVGAAFWKQESIALLRPGESLTLGGYEFLLEEVREVQGPNYMAQRGRFRVTRDGEVIALLSPEKRIYPVQNMPTTEAAIRSSVLRDLYTVIGDPDGTGAYTVRIYIEPLVPWLWFGSGLMVLGGLVSLSDRRLRVGAPARQPVAPRKVARA